MPPRTAACHAGNAEGSPHRLRAPRWREGVAVVSGVDDRDSSALGRRRGGGEPGGTEQAIPERRAEPAGRGCTSP